MATSSPSSAAAGSSTAAMAVVAAATETATGSQVVRIDDYSKTKRELGVGGSIKSGTFRAGGHGWYILCYPGGDYLTVFLCLEVQDHGGAEDEVKARYEFTLLNHAGEAIVLTHGLNAFSSSKGTRIGCDFNELKVLESSPLLAGDTVQIRCDVTVVKEFTALRLPELHRHIGGLLASQQVAGDVTFDVGGELFTAHRCVLAARSTVFIAELFAPGKLQDTASATHVRINDMEPKVFKGLLHFIYTDSLPEVNEGDDDKVAMAQGLLVAADRYGMERLKLICGDVLSIYVDADTAVATLELAVKHGCHGLKEVCIKILKDLIAKVAS